MSDSLRLFSALRQAADPDVVDAIQLLVEEGRDRVVVAAPMWLGYPSAVRARVLRTLVRRLGGRPHWGKMHTQTAETLRDVYPRFDDFLRVRDELDPERRFANPYLDRVLGGAAQQGTPPGAPGAASGVAGACIVMMSDFWSPSERLAGSTP